MIIYFTRAYDKENLCSRVVYFPSFKYEYYINIFFLPINFNINIRVLNLVKIFILN